MSETYPELPLPVLAALCDRLEALGWQVEYATACDMKIARPDPDTGFTVQFTEWWLSWRETDGRLGYGIADDRNDPWRQHLDADPLDVRAVADAADRAMHALWHQEEREYRRTLEAENRQLRAMEQRMECLGRRIVVTPGMLRAALKRHGRVRP